MKEGDDLDALTATELLRETFLLPEPRCPHGRPLWQEITLEELLRGVRRVV